MCVDTFLCGKCYAKFFDEVLQCAAESEANAQSEVNVQSEAQPEVKAQSEVGVQSEHDVLSEDPNDPAVLAYYNDDSCLSIQTHVHNVTHRFELVLELLPRVEPQAAVAAVQVRCATTAVCWVFIRCIVV